MRRVDDGAADDGADLAAYVAALARDAARPRVPLLGWVVAVPAQELEQLQPTPIELDNPAACGLFGGGVVGAGFSSRLSCASIFGRLRAFLGWPFYALANHVCACVCLPQARTSR